MSWEIIKTNLFTLPKERKAEPNTRFVRKILVKLIELGHSPLTKTRDPRKRFIGTCRDFAILACAIFRYKGVPARLRCGFANYFYPDWYSDHRVCEYWDDYSQQGRLLDAEINQVERDYYQIKLDQTNVPRENFLVEGRTLGKFRKPIETTPRSRSAEAFVVIRAAAETQGLSLWKPTDGETHRSE